MAVPESATPSGLTSAEAARRLAESGPNLLPSPGRRSPWRSLAEQFVHFFALLLWVAAALAFIAGMPQLGVAIVVVIIVNGLFAFLQQTRAERAAARLRELVPRRTLALRDGEWRTIAAADVVPGDLLRISAGDRVPADGTLRESRSLALDLSMISGESAAVAPAPGDDVFGGCLAVAGEGTLAVTATGRATRLAGIVNLAGSARHRRSPLAIELDRLVRTVAVMAAAVGGLFFIVAVLVGTPLSDGFLFAVGVTVALVPEGLLPTVTLSLALGAQRMAARQALVRRLDAVETLGATTFICTDKTGTLTMNEMQVVEAWTPAGSIRIEGSGYAPEAALETDPGAADPIAALAMAAALCSEGRAVHDPERGWLAEGDPMEAALDAFAARTNGVSWRAAAPGPGAVFPFDAVRRRMSVVAGGRVITKGAPEAVLPVCAPEPRAAAAIEALAARGLRVIAVAARPAESAPASAEAAEAGLELLGIAGLQDPPRPGVREAIASCRRAGVRIAMVTGDHPLTATAIARDIGLWTDGSRCVAGSDFPQDEQLLGALVDRDGAVLARVAPEQKLMVARALKARGHVVAMTGDGVNDGPALEEADVGVAMGRRGTDVAREAADLVLLDDEFTTIVAAIEEGRTTFENIRRFLTYHLTDNVAELTPFLFWALSGGRFPLALGVLQILALDIGTDLLPALSLGAEASRGDELARPLTGRHLVDRAILWRVFAVLGPAEAAIEMLAYLAVFTAAGWRPGNAFPEGGTLLRASGAAFSAVVLGQLANAFACRSAERFPWQLGFLTNRALLGAVAVELVLLGCFLGIPPIADALEQRPPALAGTMVALSAVPLVLAVDAVQKWFANVVGGIRNRKVAL